MAFEIDARIEVYAPGGQHLLLKQTDLTVTRLSRVFKVSWVYDMVFSVIFKANSYPPPLREELVWREIIPQEYSVPHDL